MSYLTIPTPKEQTNKQKQTTTLKCYLPVMRYHVVPRSRLSILYENKTGVFQL